MAEQADLALIAERTRSPGDNFFRGLDQRLPARAVEPLDQGRLDLRLGLATDAAPLELGRNHLGIVDDELVARLEPVRQIGNAAVAQDPVPCTTSIRATSRGLAGRSAMRIGGLEVEEIGAHVSPSPPPARGRSRTRDQRVYL